MSLTQLETMGEARFGEALDVGGGDEVASVDKCGGLDGGFEGEGSAGADADFYGGVGAGFGDYFVDVVVGGVFDEDVAGKDLEGFDVLFFDCGLDVDVVVVEGSGAEHGFFGLGVWVAHGDAHEEAVELGVGEGECGLEVDWVLGGDDDEGTLDGVGFTVDGDESAFHGFE